MNRTRNSTAAERLKDFAREPGQSGAIAPTRGAEPLPPTAQTQQRDQTGAAETEPELTLQRLSDTLLAAIQHSTESLTGKIDEVRVDETGLAKSERAC